MELSQCDNIDNKNQVAGFIKKTFEILEVSKQAIQNTQFNKIIFWGPNGKQFTIKEISKFQQIVLPKYFRHKNINSFIRQLNMYGFHKGKKDSSKCVFSHPHFVRDMESKLHLIKRKFKINQIQEAKLSIQNILCKPDISLNLQIPLSATKTQQLQELNQKPIITNVQKIITPIKNNKYIISTRDLINTGPKRSFVKLSRIQIPSQISIQSQREDCLSIEGKLQQNNKTFNNRFVGISLMNTLNFLDDLGF